jgi:hypothetical protein
MIHLGESYFDPHLVAEILENVTVKLLDIVDSYLSGHSKMADYVLLEKNLLSPAATILIRGFASIYLVKYSTAITAYL